MFTTINPQQSFPQLEEEILRFWKKRGIFEKSVQKRLPAKRFVFYDGPPFATGLPHYGHIVASLIKDIIPRYKTMRGFRVERRWGWDCHGLPIENLIEKEQKIKNKKEIEANIKDFNQACRKRVLRYRDYWREFVPRIGRWVDMERDYRTMDSSYMESIWWVFKELYKKGLIYEDYKSMHLCPRCETTLSNFEVSLGYKEVEDLSVVVKFQVEENSAMRRSLDKTPLYFLAWTTTPWTLPGNAALAVNPELEYALVTFAKRRQPQEYYLLAKERIDFLLQGQRYQIIKLVEGSELVGMKYRPLFRWSKKEKRDEVRWSNAFQVYPADFVNLEEGTGIVHIAPSFGEDDLEMGKKHNLPFIQHINPDGTFRETVSLCKGEKVKPKTHPQRTDRKIAQYLKKRGLLFEQRIIKHSYPHCWRCDTPLLNYRANSWFVKVKALKKRLIRNNQKINWVPAHIKEGRFGKWLQKARDWAISRSRYWGTPLPVWRCEKCQRIKVIGSLKELVKEAARGIEKIKISPPTYDLHRPFIDYVELRCRCGGRMKRVVEVFDCWFESGSMPYAQHHYLGRVKRDFAPHQKKGFPADFIAEGIDQTRGWFYTLHILATALFNEVAYKQVVVNGIVLAGDGKKMSKRLKNYPDPAKIIQRYGADALRLYLVSSPVVEGRNLNFSERDLKRVLQQVLLHLWNVFYFFVTYANIDNWRPTHLLNKPLQNLLDQWILSRLHSLILQEKKLLDSYHLWKAAREFNQFIDQLSNWYVRRSRRRFWKSENDQDKEEAYQTLYTVLLNLSKLMAPFIPFISEYIYCVLTKESKGRMESVHLCDYPVARKSFIKEELNEKMDQVLRIVKLAHQIRNKIGFSLRQPLSEIKIERRGKKLKDDFLELIQEEANVKKVSFVKSLENFFGRQVKLNLSLLGKKYGPRLKEIKEEVERGRYSFTQDKLKVKNFILQPSEFKIDYLSRNEEKWQIAYEKDLVVLLNIELTPSLKREYQERELVRKIQEERKRRSFRIESYIKIYYNIKDSKVRKLLNSRYVKDEVLAKELVPSTRFKELIKKENKLFLNKRDWIYLKEVQKTGN